MWLSVLAVLWHRFILCSFTLVEGYMQRCLKSLLHCGVLVPVYNNVKGSYQAYLFRFIQLSSDYCTSDNLSCCIVLPALTLENAHSLTRVIPPRVLMFHWLQAAEQFLCPKYLGASLISTFGYVCTHTRHLRDCSAFPTCYRHKHALVHCGRRADML